MQYAIVMNVRPRVGKSNFQSQPLNKKIYKKEVKILSYKVKNVKRNCKENGVNCMMQLHIAPNLTPRVPTHGISTNISNELHFLLSCFFCPLTSPIKTQPC